MSEPDLSTLDAAQLLAAYTRAVLAGSGAAPLEAELLRRLADRDRLREALAEALELIGSDDGSPGSASAARVAGRLRTLLDQE